MKLNSFPARRFRNAFFAGSLGLAILPVVVEAFPAPQWMQGGHSARISGLACSPDGTMIASSSEDGTVKLWSKNGALLKTLSTQPYPTTAVAWSPDGTEIAAGTYYGDYSYTSGQGLTYLWQALNGWTNNVNLVRTTVVHSGKVTALAFSSDSAELASGCASGNIAINSVTNGSAVASRQAYAAPAAVTSLSFSGGMMASGCEDATVRVFNTDSWGLLWTSTTNIDAQTTNATAVAFSPDGSMLASASLDQTVKIWSTGDWTLLRTFTGHTNGVTSVAFSPDGLKLVSGDMNGALEVWDWSSTNCLVTVPAHALPVTATLFSVDGSFVISSGEDGSARIWSPADGAPICMLGGQNSFIGAVAISPDGTLCASAGGDETVQVRNTSDGSLVRALTANTNYVRCLAFSPDSARLASGGGPLDPAIKIWQISDGALLNTIPATTNGVMAMAWSPDGSMLAAGGDPAERNITLWSTNGLAPLQTLLGHTNGVTALAFSPKGDLLASGGRRSGYPWDLGNMVRIWRLSETNILRIFTSPSADNNVECVAFSPDGTRVAIGSTGVGVLRVGVVSDGSIATLSGGAANPVYSVVYSADGSTLAATYLNTVQIWTNGSSWALCETITNETVRASCLAYSPNGNFLLCGRNDGTVAMLPNTRGAVARSSLQFTSIFAAPPTSSILGAAVQPWTHYVLQTSPDLFNWSFLRLASTTNASSLSILDTAPDQAPARFYRALTPP